MATPRKPPGTHLKRGHPTDYRPDFHNEDYLRLAAEGKGTREIATEWKLHVDTLYEWAKKHPEFSDTMKLGKQYAETHYLKLGHAGGMLGILKDKEGKKISVDLGFFKLLTQNKFGWCTEIKKTELQGKLQVNTFVDLVKELEQEEDEQ